MRMDEEGFIRPCVDASACIHCNLCNKICPVAEGKEREPSDFLSAYAGWNSSMPELTRSSSGGIFSLLANHVLDAGGVVCGAVYDNTGHVHHDFAETTEGLLRMRGSKYVQSEMRDCFPQIRNLLNGGRHVLFSGTGCQVAGLKSYLGKEYDKLLTVEIVCEGTPSPGLWERHLKHVCSELREVHYLSFRDKVYGWTKTLVVRYDTNSGERKEVAIPAAREPYIKLMFAAVSQARNCYQCRFREGRSGADILIGDMWGLGIVAPEAKPSCGASVILCNSEYGQRVLEQVEGQMAFCKQISPLSAAINNGYLYRTPVIDFAAREYLFQNYKAGKQLADYAEAALKRANRVAILNHAGHSNYGSNLTAFALQETLRRMGYDARTVSLKPFRANFWSMVRPFSSFINTCIRWTRDVYGPRTCATLNRDFDTFVVGSDQVWRYPKSWLRRFAEPAFYLDFAAQGKRRIAYAASFGIGEYCGPASHRGRMKKALLDFDSVSVREEQGLQILAEQFGYKGASAVMDPVFLISRRDWQRFSQAADADVPSGCLSWMFFFNESRMLQPLEAYARQKDMQQLNLSADCASVMTWLRRIENSALVVTDSFHTLCFALIFRKPFVVVSSESHGMSRLASLLEALSLRGRIIDTETTDESDLLKEFVRIAEEEIDYELVEQQLARLVSHSLGWLKTAMQKPVSTKHVVVKPSSIWMCLERVPLMICRILHKLRGLRQKVLRRIHPSK